MTILKHFKEVNDADKMAAVISTCLAQKAQNKFVPFHYFLLALDKSNGFLINTFHIMP